MPLTLPRLEDGRGWCAVERLCDRIEVAERDLAVGPGVTE
jgi:hypothetical protein